MPEPRRHLAEENKAADEDGLRLLCQHLGLENFQIVTLFRLGRQSTGNVDHLKLCYKVKHLESTCSIMPNLSKMKLQRI